MASCPERQSQRRPDGGRCERPAPDAVCHRRAKVGDDLRVRVPRGPPAGIHAARQGAGRLLPGLRRSGSAATPLPGRRADISISFPTPPRRALARRRQPASASRRAPELVDRVRATPFVVAMLRNPVAMICALHNERVSQLRPDHHVRSRAAAAASLRRRRAWHFRARARDGSSPRRRALRRAARTVVRVRWPRARPRDRLRRVQCRSGSEVPTRVEFLQVDPDYQPPSFAARNASHAPACVRPRISIEHGPRWLTRCRPAAEDRAKQTVGLALRSVRQAGFNRGAVASAAAVIRRACGSRPSSARRPIGGTGRCDDLLARWFGADILARTYGRIDCGAMMI